MAINETVLFTYLRRAPFGGSLKQDQVDGVKRLIRICSARNVTDLRHVANVLAQVFHETGGRMQPVREGFQNSDGASIAVIEKAWKAGRLGKVKTPYWRGGWFGRGDIQITHKANYAKMGKALDVDLVGNPSRALEPETSGHIAVVGMRDGLFTGKKLADYFNTKKDDPKGARAIVNGSDKASLIAGYHVNFLGALKAAETSSPMPADVSTRAAQPDDVKPSESKSVWTTVTTYLSGVGFTGFSLFDKLDNPFALAALIFLIVAGGVVTWLLMSGRLTINRSANDAGLDTGATPMVDAAGGSPAASGSDLSLVGNDLGLVPTAPEDGADSDGPRVVRVPRRQAPGVAKRKGTAKAAKRASGTKKAGGRA